MIVVDHRGVELNFLHVGREDVLTIVFALRCGALVSRLLRRYLSAAALSFLKAAVVPASATQSRTVLLSWRRVLACAGGSLAC